jgi:hypothetical protein
MQDRFPNARSFHGACHSQDWAAHGVPSENVPAAESIPPHCASNPMRADRTTSTAEGPGCRSAAGALGAGWCSVYVDVYFAAAGAAPSLKRATYVAMAIAASHWAQKRW